MVDEGINIELTKILGKVMQSSYKKKEVCEIIDRIIEKIEKRVVEKVDEGEIRKLRMEFEEIRKIVYEL